jgi:thiamine biosynthesis lipoprotein
MAATETLARPAWRWAATGTTWQIHHTGGVSQAAATTIAAAVERDEARWSRFQPSSIVSHINQSAGTAVTVDAETFKLLQECRRWTERTGGVFQPLVGGALEAWGYRASVLEQAPGVPVSPPDRPTAGEIELDGGMSRVRIPAGTRLDLGGIAKSWMARRAARLVARLSEDEQILIDAGGDLAAARGDHRIAVERPDVYALNRPETPAGEASAWVKVYEGEGIATSGYGRRRWVNQDGVGAHHLIDPDLGRPGPETHATVIASDVVAADVLAKTLALRPDSLFDHAVPAIVAVGGAVDSTAAWDEREAA